jgi:hypothetical protein
MAWLSIHPLAVCLALSALYGAVSAQNSSYVAPTSKGFLMRHGFENILVQVCTDQAKTLKFLTPL